MLIYLSLAIYGFAILMGLVIGAACIGAAVYGIYLIFSASMLVGFAYVGAAVIVGAGARLCIGALMALSVFVSGKAARRLEKAELENEGQAPFNDTVSPCTPLNERLEKATAYASELVAQQIHEYEAAIDDPSKDWRRIHSACDDFVAGFALGLTIKNLEDRGTSEAEIPEEEMVGAVQAALSRVWRGRSVKAAEASASEPFSCGLVFGRNEPESQSSPHGLTSALLTVCSSYAEMPGVSLAEFSSRHYGFSPELFDLAVVAGDSMHQRYMEDGE